MREWVLFLFLCLPIWLNAQFVINGQVSDAETKEALDKAIVKVLNGNKQLIAYTITDKSGNYSVKIKTGTPDKPCGVRTVANPKLLLNDT